jgi:methionyl-tRNA formyltransferase
MAKELDAGDIVAETEPIPIAPDDTAATLGARLAEASGNLLAGALPLLLRGNPPQRPQNATETRGATFCRTIRKEDGAVDFTGESALEIERKCRAYTPWPGCHAYLGTRRLGLLRLELADPPPDGPDAKPGLLRADGRIAAREGWLRLVQVKPEGKGAMDFQAFRNGNPGAVGARLSLGPVQGS